MIQDNCIMVHESQQNITGIDEQDHVMHHGQLITMDLLQHQQLQQFQQHQHPQQQPLLQQQQQSQQQQQQLQHQHVLHSTPPLYQQNNSQLTQNVFILVDEPKTNNDMNSDAAPTEVANTSDASTIEDSINENEIPNDDAFTYLQGLNSDNLMQFSQQSALQELMMKEQLDVKPPQNFNVLPTFEQHDYGGYKFQLNLSSQRKSKTNWIYSEALNKVYIRMNDIFNVEASYTPKIPMQQLRIRALICFVKEVSEPVLRCQNHLSADTESHPNARVSLLRCENPTAEYRGQAQGKSINDRLSILVPLSSSVNPGPDNAQKQTIALKFTCQNSCIGRKETSIIFLLESMNGEILSQRVLDVKICSCPKRDKAMDERNLEIPKRKMDTDVYPRKKKMRKQNYKSPFSHVKEECSESDLDENSSDSNSNNSFDVQCTPSGGIRVVFEMPTKETAAHAIECGYNKLGAEVLKNTNHSARFAQYFRKMKKLNDKIQKL